MSRLSLVGCVALLALAFTACSTAVNGDEEDLADAAVQLGYVAVALDGFTEFGEGNAGLSSDELLHQATAANPASLEALKEYSLKARQVGRFSSVLMCNKKGEIAYAEDAGCTASKLDRNLFTSPPSNPAKCEFSLDPQTTCPAK